MLKSRSLDRLNAVAAAIPRGWIILGFALLAWGVVIAAFALLT